MVHDHATTFLHNSVITFCVDKALKLFIDQTKAVMAEQKVSQAELARRLNKPPSNISRYLSGDISPGIELMQEWADALGVPIWRLVKAPEEDDLPPEQANTIWFLRKVIVDKEKLNALSLIISDDDAFQAIKGSLAPFLKRPTKGKNVSAS
jgi:transcriptional regulator with XRE-family HTH domain